MRLVHPEAIEPSAQAETDRWQDILPFQWRANEMLLRTPVVRGAYEALAHRLLGPGWRIGPHGSRSLHISDEIQQTITKTWYHFVRQLLFNYFAFGIAVIGVEESKEEGVPGLPFCVEPTLLRVQVMATLEGGLRYRVGPAEDSAVTPQFGLGTTGRRRRMPSYVISEMSPPTCQGLLDSPASSLRRLMAIGDAARECAAFAWQKNANPAIYTEVTSSDQQVEPGVDLMAFGDGVRVNAMASDEQRAVAAAAGVPVAVAPLAAGEEAGDTPVVQRGDMGLAWTYEEARSGLRLPVRFSRLGDFLPPTVALPPGRKLVDGPAATAPSMTALHEEECMYVAMATGVPVSVINPSSGSGHVTMLATDASVQQMDKVVRHYSEAVKAVLELMLSHLYGTAALASKIVSRALPLTSAAALTKAANECRFEVVFMSTISMLDLEKLYQEGSINKETYRDYLSRTMHIPHGDLQLRTGVAAIVAGPGGGAAAAGPPKPKIPTRGGAH